MSSSIIKVRLEMSTQALAQQSFTLRIAGATCYCVRALAAERRGPVFSGRAGEGGRGRARCIAQDASQGAPQGIAQGAGRGRAAAPRDRALSAARSRTRVFKGAGCSVHCNVYFSGWPSSKMRRPCFEARLADLACALRLVDEGRLGDGGQKADPVSARQRARPQITENA